MKPVDQTAFGPEKGNCFSAVIASLLELSVDDVPMFCDPEEGWYLRFQAWLAERGWTSIEVPCSEAWSPNDRQLCWIVGPSPRHNCHHAIVGRFLNGEYEMVHDPHPSRDGLVDSDVVGFLIPLDPMEVS